jgi:O-antigen ligase
MCGLYNQELEYKKFEYYKFALFLLLLIFYGQIAVRYLLFARKSIVIAIITFHLIFVIKLLISKERGYMYTIEAIFDNSGLYTIFLSLSATIISHYFLAMKIRYIKITLIFLNLIVISCIIILGSRTALIMSATYYLTEFLQKSQIFPRRKWLIVSVSILLLSVVLSFCTKADSTYGRLFILKTTLAIIKDHLLLGIGYGNFASVYPNYQASVYEMGMMTPKEVMLADNTHVALNEYLQITTEMGIIGFLLILSIIIVCVKYARRDRNIYISICIAMALSYILHSSIIICLIICLLAIVKLPSVCDIRKLSFYVFLLIAFMFSCHNIISWSNKHVCMTMERDLSKKNPQLLSSHYRKNKQYLCDNGRLLYFLANFNYNYGNIEDALIILSQLDHLTIRNESELLKGKCYIKKSAYNQAEKHLQRSVAICPNRFNNRYELFKFYDNNKMIEKATETASEIFHLQEKIKSPHTVAIKMEIEQYLEENKINSRR